MRTLSGLYSFAIFMAFVLSVSGQTNTSAVPQDTSEYKGHHYKVYTDTTDGDQADFNCKKVGGHLVAISDDDENDFVHRLMHKHKAVWIGAVKSMGDWRWSSGKDPFEYTHWHSKLPGRSKEEHGKAAKKAAKRKGDNQKTSGEIGDGMRGAMFGNFNKPDGKPNENSRGYWFPRPAKEPGEIEGYVCEWDY